MRKTFLVVMAAAVTWLTPAWADPASEVLALEKQGMEGWLNGDPDPQLAAVDPQIIFFDTVVEKRLDGLQAVKELYERYRGIPLFDRYEILGPDVQVSGDLAVLTYVMAQHNGSATAYWYATRVYRSTTDGWRVIHSHFSQVPEQQP